MSAIINVVTKSNKAAVLLGLAVPVSVRVQRVDRAHNSDRMHDGLSTCARLEWVTGRTLSWLTKSTALKHS
ncbi:hypothetical protein HNP02_007602 [Mycobacterium sp. AZCC_0083]|nr:hypothetical protein [Mycobacterium sp. AZCC_0083]